MKKILTLAGMLLAFYGSAQTTTVNYTASTAEIANPERGFYNHEETHSTGYDALSQSSMTNARINDKYTLILRIFYLDSFMNSPISSDYLANMQADFAKIRAAGIKCMIRFAYSDSYSAGVQQDASKAQVLAHIAQLKPVLLANGDVIAGAQAGFIGTWGEWYYTSNFGINPTATDIANRKEVLTALINAMPPGKMVMVRTPKLKQQMYNTQTPLSLTQAFTTTAVARTGHHNDCFLASDDDEGTYSNVTAEYAYLEAETKFVPMGGESCAVNAPRSKCPTALGELQKFHWSYMNLDYYPGVISGFQSDGCFQEIENRLGYRFQMTTGTFPNAANVGGVMPVVIKIANVGWAAPYNQRTAYIVFRNTTTNAEFQVALASDPRTWYASATTTISENVTLPSSMPAGSYKLFLKLPDSDSGLSTRPEYSIQMANETTWDAVKGQNDLKHTINVGTALGVSTFARPSLVAYPVPANSVLNLEFQNISTFTIAVHNTLGQTINVPATPVSNDKVTLNTSGLSNGIYFVSITNGTIKLTKQIIVAH
ncbi:MAG: DUF4832 domain-containing protein [Flavobacterium sp.]|nr:MAG: DUF4832 domain-containing protein [Flavobacterium sp.]